MTNIKIESDSSIWKQSPSSLFHLNSTLLCLREGLLNQPSHTCRSLNLITQLIIPYQKARSSSLWHLFPFDSNNSLVQHFYVRVRLSSRRRSNKRKLHYTYVYIYIVNWISEAVCFQELSVLAIILSAPMHPHIMWVCEMGHWGKGAFINVDFKVTLTSTVKHDTRLTDVIWSG